MFALEVPYVIIISCASFCCIFPTFPAAYDFNLIIFVLCFDIKCLIMLLNEVEKKPCQFIK